MDEDALGCLCMLVCRIASPVAAHIIFNQLHDVQL
jgi:hypothetical protein